MALAGPSRIRARSELADLACRVVVNDDHAAGMGFRSLRGVGHSPESVSASVALPADMPLVQSEVFGEVVESSGSGTSDLAVSRSGEQITPPILYGRALFAELREVTGDVGGKPVIRRLLESVGPRSREVRRLRYDCVVSCKPPSPRGRFFPQGG